MIKLVKATVSDCKKIYEMQIISFKDLLDKYNDFNTNPGAETLEDVLKKLNTTDLDYYLIKVDDKDIGAIRTLKAKDNIYRIATIFVLPEYQNRGNAQATILEVEKLYPQALTWQLDTIKEECKLCHLYEKLGYMHTGNEKIVKDNMTIVYYEKIL